MSKEISKEELEDLKDSGEVESEYNKNSVDVEKVKENFEGKIVRFDKIGDYYKKELGGKSDVWIRRKIGEWQENDIVEKHYIKEEGKRRLFVEFKEK